jgi:hypothetical protein
VKVDGTNESADHVQLADLRTCTMASPAVPPKQHQFIIHCEALNNSPAINSTMLRYKLGGRP